MNRFLVFLPLLLLTNSARSLELSPPGKDDYTATVQILPSQTLPHSERFMHNQIALLASGPILNPTSKNCGVTAETLAASLKIERVQDSDLITVSSLLDNKEKRQVVVRAVLNSYLDHRKRLEVALGREKMKALDQKILTQSDLVQETRKTLTVLIQQYGIPHSSGNPQSSGMTQEPLFEKARQKLMEFETMRDQIELELKKMATLKDLGLVKYAAGLDLPENQVTYYYTRYRKALDDRADKLASGLGKTHPSIKVLDTKVSEAIKNALKEAASVQEVLQVKMELVKRQVGKMTEMVKDREPDTQRPAQLHQEFNHTKAEYESARKKLRDLKAQQEELKAGLKNSHYFIIHGWE